MQCKKKFSLLAIIVIIFMFATLVSSTRARQRNKSFCSKKRICKYGGRCDSSGTCRCSFDCNPVAWQQTIYCGPKPKDGQSRQYFMNLCQLLAQACEQQKDIPIIKFNYETMRCEDEVAPSVKLCKNPLDYMGPCGGTAALDGNVGSGICLRDTSTGARRCECPITKEGYDCQVKKVMPRSVHDVEYDENNEDGQLSAFPTHVVIYGGLCLLIVISLIAVVFKRHSSHRARNRNTSEFVAVIPSATKDSIVQVDFNKCPDPCTQSLQGMKQSLSSSDNTACNKLDSIILLHSETL